jgi:predicted restriction endonuclease
MSRYKNADEIKDDFILKIYNWLGQDGIEEERYKRQKLYIVKDCLRFYKLNASLKEGCYFFGLSKTVISVFEQNQEQTRYKDYFLFICGHSQDDSAKMIYLIPSSFIINDNIKVWRAIWDDRQKIHIAEDSSDRWIMREDKLRRDLREFCMSLSDLKKFFENLDTYDKDNEFQQREIELLEDLPPLVNETREVIVKQIKRYYSITENCKRKYNNKCQIKGCGFTFKKKNGEFYSEAHHLIPLSKGGTQEENNVIILCPNHHRMMHYADVEIEDFEQNERKLRINADTHIIIYLLIILLY